MRRNIATKGATSRDLSAPGKIICHSPEVFLFSNS